MPTKIPQWNKTSGVHGMYTTVVATLLLTIPQCRASHFIDVKMTVMCLCMSFTPVSDDAQWWCQLKSAWKDISICLNWSFTNPESIIVQSIWYNVLEPPPMMSCCWSKNISISVWKPLWRPETNCTSNSCRRFHASFQVLLRNGSLIFFQVGTQSFSAGPPLSITFIIRGGTAKLLSDERLGMELPCLSWDCFFSFLLTIGELGKARPSSTPHSTEPGGTHVRSLAPFNEEQMQQCHLSLSRSFSLFHTHTYTQRAVHKGWYAHTHILKIHRHSC